MSVDSEAVELAVSGTRLTAQGYHRAPCPFCTEGGERDNKASLWLDPQTGRWGCWKCQRWGRLRGFDPEAAPPKPRPKLGAAPVLGPPEFFERLDSEMGAHSLSYAHARNYLASRGIPPGVWSKLGYGACLDGHWRGRVVVPHLDPDGETWRGWVGRCWVKKPPRGVLPYLYPAGMRRTLYNTRVLEEETDVPALAVEGALDAAHFPDRAFAFFGGPTQDHALEIKRRARRPVAVVLDGDAWRKGEYFALRLRLDGVRAGHVRLPPKADPDEVDRGWLLEEAARCVR